MNMVMIAGGGSGGHVYPGLAVAEKIKQEEGQVIWCGRPYGLERKIVKGYTYCEFSAAPLRAKKVSQQLKALIILCVGVVKMVRKIWQLRPNVLLTMGGYVSVAPAIAASIMRVPIVCFEQNAKLGMANRLIAKIAKVHLCGMKCDDSRFVCIGNPVREQIKQCKDDSKQSLLLLGGSQGAKDFYQDLLSGVVNTFTDLPVTCIVGYGNISQEHKQLMREKKVNVIEYAQDMQEIYNAAGLIVSRAGAMAISEINKIGKRVIYLPLPSKDNHQYHNAKSQERPGVMVIENQSLEQCIEGIKLWVDGLFPQPEAKSQDSTGEFMAYLQTYFENQK